MSNCHCLCQKIYKDKEKDKDKDNDPDKDKDNVPGKDKYKVFQKTTCAISFKRSGVKDIKYGMSS